MLYVLTLTIFLLNGQPMVAQAEMKDLAQCLDASSKFLAQNPADLDASGLGASCVVITKQSPA